MAMPRVKIGLRNTSDSEVVAIAINVFNGVKNNHRFPELQVYLDAFEASITELQHAIAVRRDAGEAGTADKNEQRRKVETFIRKIAAHVERLHNDDLAALLSAGFPGEKYESRAKSDSQSGHPNHQERNHDSTRITG